MDQQAQTKKTLKQIYQILHKHIHEYMECSEKCNDLKPRPRSDPVDKRPHSKDAVIYQREQCICKSHVHQESRMEIGQSSDDTLQKGSDDIRSVSSKEKTGNSTSKLKPNRDDSITPLCDYEAYPSDNCIDETNDSSIHQKLKVICSQNLDILRENAELNIKMQEIGKLIKHLPLKDDTECSTLESINEILSKVDSTQKRSEILCDKLCEGLSKSSKMMSKLPKELKEFCDKITKTAGHEYRQIGRELELTPEEIKDIEREYEDEGDCLYQVILEWSKKSENSSYHALVTACNNVNPDILNMKPLQPQKVKVLEKCYRSLCDEIVEAPILPHLISAGVMSFRQQRYVLQAKTTDQRVSYLINIICTRERGFDELLKALDITYQAHVSNFLRTTLSRMQNDVSSSTNSCETVEDSGHEIDRQNPVALSSPMFRKRIGSSNSLDFDDNKSLESVISFHSSPAISDPNTVLKLILELILKAQNQ